jgi:histidine triad (HIT) family protein
MPTTAKACVFCAIINGEQQAAVVLQTDALIAFLDHRPLFRGHTLLVPKRHVVLLSDLPAEAVPEFFSTAQRLERAVEDGLGADGSMILINNVVSQSVPHLHLHVIPRSKGDGLRLWLGPRQRYDDAHPAAAYAEKIRGALKLAGPDVASGNGERPWPVRSASGPLRPADRSPFSRSERAVARPDGQPRPHRGNRPDP